MHVGCTQLINAQISLYSLHDAPTLLNEDATCRVSHFFLRSFAIIFLFTVYWCCFVNPKVIFILVPGINILPLTE